LYGSGKPRAAHEGVIELVSAFLAILKASEALWVSQPANFRDLDRFSSRPKHACRILVVPPKPAI
jgi:hypothetical protein